MFGGSRRRRPPVQPLTKETANPNAATAAASAFMRREPSVSLSSAAAAAALRARPTTPTNVAEVQTKRAARRSPSVSSIGSRDRGRSSLQRSPSVGSMSERSFRSPSPGRGRIPHQPQQDVPPVPKLPQDGRLAAATKAAGAGPKHLSLQTQPFRTASQKMKDGQTGSWFGAATAGDPQNVRKSDLVLQTSFGPHEPRPGSISPSINFSYPRPRSASIDSHSTPSPIVDNAMVYDPNSRRMVPKIDLLERQSAVREASEKPVKKKKKSQEPSRSGSHLSKGTVGRTKAPALEGPVADVSSRTPQSETRIQAEPSGRLAKGPTLSNIEDADSESEDEIPPAVTTQLPEPQTFASETNGSALAPKPIEPSPTTAVVVEPSTVPRDAALLNSVNQVHGDENLANAAPTVDTTTELSGTTQGPANVQDSIEEDKGLADEMSTTIAARQPKTLRRERVHSESPARTAHFASTTDQLFVRHEPPSRSLSPRKSALKHRSPTRGVSPSDDGSEASGSVNRDDSTFGRKKSVRVSFDQNTVVVGEAATAASETDSPVAPSPQASKKPWHSIIGKQNKKEHIPLDEDETMTPRPALPLFGSVREKKTKEPEERPLVRPLERNWSPSPVSPVPRQSSPFNPPVAKSQQSTDAAPESPLTDQPLKHEANTSRYREPLPPVVTSVEGSGYISSSASSSEDEDEHETLDHNATDSRPDPLPPKTKSPAVDREAAQVLHHPEPISTGAAPIENEPLHADHSLVTKPVSQHIVPDISISQPSPSIHGTPQPNMTPQQEYFDVPGGFPEEDDSSDYAAAVPQEVVPEAAPLSDKKPTQKQGASTSAAPIANTPASAAFADAADNALAHDSSMADIKEEEEQSDTSSIYSDAYEDLSDVDGDGFMSLDAVVTAPIAKKGLDKSARKPNADQTPPKTLKTSKTLAEDQPSPSQHLPDDWENAKAYWRSLSTDKRRQLEVEAMHEAGDTPQVKAESKRDSKPKKTQQTAADGHKVDTAAKQPNGHDRTYQIQPGTKWPQESRETRPKARANDRGGGMKLRKSMRQEDSVSNGSPTGTMRKSLRSGPPRTSMVADGHAEVAVGNGSPSKPTGRPVSYQPRSTTGFTGGHRQAEGKLSKADPFTGPAAQPSRARRDSDASESSFTRARTAPGEGFGFKKTMRRSMYEPTAAKPASEQIKGSSRFSLRSLSPTGSAFRRTSVTSSPSAAGGGLRHSLRGEPNEASSSRIRLPTFSKGTGKKTKSKTGGSRFADSSDEEDGRTAFSSRFADSSDEDDTPAPKARGQGLPKSLRNNRSSAPAAAAVMTAPAPQRRDTESPDLTDSDDEVEPQRRATNGAVNGMTNGKTPTTLHRSGSGRGNLARAHQTTAAEPNVTPDRPTHSRRGSFLSTILGRKKGSGGKISKGTGESAARRDTPLERSTEELSMIRTGSNSKSSIQRRGPSWPFPDEPSLGTTATTRASTTALTGIRPSTAGGAAHSSKPNHLTRRSASYNGPPAATAADNQSDVLAESHLETPKKKKFGTLRKMFRLND